MQKVRLLNDGGYDGAKNVSFPVEVEVMSMSKSKRLVHVSEDELVRVGFQKEAGNEYAVFLMGIECELAEERS